MQPSFEDIAIQFEPMIKNQIKKLNIYKDFDHFYQCGLVGLWEAYERFDHTKGAFPAFAYQTVRGHMLMELRKQNTYEQRYSPVEDEHFSYLADEQHDSFLEEGIIETYCKGLSNREQLWVKQAFLFQKKPSEIAKDCNVSVETVKSWRKSALKKLRMRGRL